ncbi:MAG TPA: oligosaccharide flippase family protein [Verrucomicrobiae bacterium]|nr:oligosaccharide flippase family protein [Verrucomicrobiae bacterium]
MSLRNKLFADGIYTFVFRIGNMAVAALLSILTARVLGPHGRGLYALPLVAFAVASAGYAGLNNATSYFMLREAAGRSVIRAALLAAAAFVVVGIPVAVFVAYTTHAPWAAVAAIAALPSPAILAIFYGYQIGIDRVRMNTTYALAGTLVTLACMLVAFATIGRTAAAAVTAWVIASDIFAAGALVWLVRHSRQLPAGEISTTRFLAYAARVGAVFLISLLNYRADVYIVAAFTSTAELGMYTLAVTAAEMLLAATQVTAVVSSPKIGGMESSQGAAELAARCVRHNVLIALATCGLLSVLAPIAIRILYGTAFLPMIPAFRLLLLGVFALSLGSPMSTYFTIRLGKPQIPMLLAGLSAGICIAVALALVRRYGLVGAALGSTLGYVIGQGAAIIVFMRIARIGFARILIPRWSDVTAYAYASNALLRRWRRAT